MATIGEILRRERDRQGVTLSTIAQQTRIKLQFLEALEEDQHHLLPGRFFVRSFSLQYAEKLGLNTDELLATLQKIAGETSGSSPMSGSVDEPRLGTLFPERPALDPLPEGTASLLNAKKLAHSVAMLVSVVVGCGLLFWLWQTQLGTTSAGTSKPRARQSVPEAVSPPAAQPVASAPEPVAPASALPQPAVSRPAEAQTVGAPAGRINLVLTASDNTWVRVTVDNKVILEKMLVSGESAVAAANVWARILTGNAGALGVRFNGADVGPLGPKGFVQTVSFTPERFQMEQQFARPATSSSTSPVAQSSASPIAAPRGLN